MPEKVRGTINLVEVIAVILAVGIFMTLIIPKLGIERRMEDKCHKNLERIAKAESLYFLQESVYTDDYEDLKDIDPAIDKINYCPLDSATYILRFKKDTLEVDPSMPDSALYGLDFTDTTKTKYVEINKKSYIIKCVYGHGEVKDHQFSWKKDK